LVHLHHMSGLSGGKLVWSILFAKEIDLIGRWHYVNIILWLWVCDTAQQHKPSSIFLFWVIWCLKIVLLYHSKIYLRYSSGQRLRDGARLWQVAKYGKPTEILNTNRNGIFFQKWHGHNQQSNHGHTKHTKQFLHEGIIPLRIACSAVNLWVTVNTCHKVRTKTSKTCTNFLKYHKLRFVA